FSRDWSSDVCSSDLSIAKVDDKAFIAMENTGYHNHNLYQVLESFDFNVYVVDPKHIKRSIGLVRGKNDKVDANRIAVFIERNHQDFECWKPCSEAIKSLKILMSQRKSKIRSEEHRLNSSHVKISYAVFNLKKKIINHH